MLGELKNSILDGIFQLGQGWELFQLLLLFITVVKLSTRGRGYNIILVTAIGQELLLFGHVFLGLESHGRLASQVLSLRVLCFLSLLLFELVLVLKLCIVPGELVKGVEQPLEDVLFQHLVGQVQHEGFQIVLLLLVELNLDLGHVSLRLLLYQSDHLVQVLLADFSSLQRVDDQLLVQRLLV